MINKPAIRPIIRPALTRLVRGQGRTEYVNRGYMLEADPTYRGRLLDADPLLGLFRSWENDPPSADRVGRYLVGTPTSAPIERKFGDIFTFSRASKAQSYSANGVSSEVAQDQIRQDYDPATLQPAGWRIEGAATNILYPTDDITSAFWVKTGCSAGSPISNIDGVTPMYLLAEDAAAASGHFIRRTSTIAANTGEVWTISAIGKEPSGNLNKRYLSLVVQNGTPWNANTGCTFDLGAGTVTATLSGAVGRIRPLGNGLWLCEVQLPAAVGTGTFNVWVRLNAVASAVTQAYDGDGASGLYVGGLQMELGTYASSRISNASTTVAATRATDNLSIEGSAFTALFGAGAPQGCVIADVVLSQLAGAAGQAILQLDDGSNSKRLLLRNVANTATLGPLISGGIAGSGEMPWQANTFTPGAMARVGARWSRAGTAACVNGGALSTTANAPVASMTALRFGNQFGSGLPLNGRILRVRTLAYAPDDAVFKALCTLGA